jgi:hypothetical protein
MLEFLRKSDPYLDRFLAGRGGIHKDDHLSIEYASVRLLLNQEFSGLVAELIDGENSRKVVKRRPGAVDLSQLAPLIRKR